MTTAPGGTPVGVPEPERSVGAFVNGRPDAARQVVRWHDQFRDHHELAEAIDPEREAYLSAFCYPPGVYVGHFKASGHSPRGYAGPAACPYLLFDIDRAGDLSGALTDTRALFRFLLGRYGPRLEPGLGVYFSGGKGFHVLVELAPAHEPDANVPATCKRLALTLAAKVGLRIDTGCYDHQRLVRLPNSRHPKTGLYKRFLSHEEVLSLPLMRVQELAREPSAWPVPRGEPCEVLQDDWNTALTEVAARPAPNSGRGHPVVPKFVRDFIGFADVCDPGRAVTLFRCAATLAEAGTPAAVVFGLLEEPALKSGLEPPEVRRQITAGIGHGRKKGGFE